MEKENIICIVCPMGCSLEVEHTGGEIISISGYGCKRGRDYGMAEITDPRRMLTTTVRVENGKIPVLPVKSEKPLPRDLLIECMKVINPVKVKAPVAMGEVVVENILGTGINIIATRTVEEK